jgi:hypothetical protein
MTDTNPPQERGAEIPKQDLTRLTALLLLAQSEFARMTRRRTALLRPFPSDDEFDGDGRFSVVGRFPPLIGCRRQPR